jgi:hypothetical protein
MKKILSGNDPMKDKIIKAFQEFSGLEITQLDPNVKEKLNACLIKLNSILLQYNIKTFEDYNQITKVHLDKMIETLKKICLILKNNF